MSWFDTASFASLAKTAINQAQKRLDKVLDIEEDQVNSSSSTSSVEANVKSSPRPSSGQLLKSTKKEKPLAAQRKVSKHDKPGSRKNSNNLSTKSPSSSNIEGDEFFSDFLGSKPVRRDAENQVGTPVQTKSQHNSELQDVPTSTPVRTSTVERSTNEQSKRTGGIKSGVKQTGNAEPCNIAARAVGQNGVTIPEKCHKIEDQTYKDTSVDKEIDPLLKPIEETDLLSSCNKPSDSLPNNELCSEHVKSSVEQELLKLEPAPELLVSQNSSDSMLKLQATDVDCKTTDPLTNTNDTLETVRDFKCSTIEPSADDRVEYFNNDEKDGVSCELETEEDSGMETHVGESPLQTAINCEQEEQHDILSLSDNSSVELDVTMKNKNGELEHSGICSSEKEVGLTGSSSDETIEKATVTISPDLLLHDGVHETDHALPKDPSLKDVSTSLVSDDQENCDEDKKDVQQLHAVIKARESRLVLMSKENIELQEAVEQFKSQILRLEELRMMANDEDSPEMRLREEITKLEGELEEAVEEAHTLKEQIREQEVTLKSSVDESERYSKVLQEKEDIIAELLEEGEKLSKRELQLSNKIKRLSARCKESEGKLEQERNINNKKLEEIEQLNEISKEKQEKQDVLLAEVKRLESITDQQEDEISALKENLDDLQEKMVPLKEANEVALLEINRLNLVCAQKASEAQEEAIHEALKEQKVLQEQLKNVEGKAEQEKVELLQKIEDLQLALTRAEHQSSRKEDRYKLEVTDLQMRLQAAEDRNQDLAESVTTATRPLIRQIDNIQVSHKSQLQSLESVERNLTNRLVAAEEQCVLACENERASRDAAASAKSRVTALDTQLMAARTQCTSLAEELEKKDLAITVLHDELKSFHQVISAKEIEHRLALEKAEDDKRVAESRLLDEKIHFEAEFALLKSGVNTAHINSVDSAAHEVLQQDVPSSPAVRRSRSSSSSSVNTNQESQMRTPTTAALENMHTQLQRREGEIVLLKEEITDLEKTKASLAQELVNLSKRNDDMQLDQIRFEELEMKLKDLQQKYSAVLQMYGEKEEEVEELQMDLADVKQMYRQQIEQLLE